jgi:hypothetical protein
MRRQGPKPNIAHVDVSTVEGHPTKAVLISGGKLRSIMLADCRMPARKWSFHDPAYVLSVVDSGYKSIGSEMARP